MANSIGYTLYKDYLHILSRFDGQTLGECSRSKPGGALAEVELDALADLRELVALGFVWLRKGHAIELSATGKLFQCKSKGVCDDAQCLFIAPSIYVDSLKQIRFAFADGGNIIRPYTIAAFSEWLQTATALYK